MQKFANAGCFSFSLPIPKIAYSREGHKERITRQKPEGAGQASVVFQGLPSYLLRGRRGVYPTRPYAGDPSPGYRRHNVRLSTGLMYKYSAML